MRSFHLASAFAILPCISAWAPLHSLFSVFRGPRSMPMTLNIEQDTVVLADPLSGDSELDQQKFRHTVVPAGERIRKQISINDKKRASVISRTVPICGDWAVTVWEWEKPSAVVETYWQVEQQGLALTPSSPLPEKNRLLDPFGLISWPGSVVAAQEMLDYSDLIKDKRVLVLGSGVGIEAQAAASLGAKSVLATDIHPTTLKLLEHGAKEAGLDDVISTEMLDLYSDEPLPECDVMIIADVLYNDDLGMQVIRRIIEGRSEDPNMVVLVSDSQRFVNDFDKDLNQLFRALDQPRVAWMSRRLPSFTGSGVLVDADQTYPVKARVIWIGNPDA